MLRLYKDLATEAFFSYSLVGSRQFKLQPIILQEYTDITTEERLNLCTLKSQLCTIVKIKYLQTEKEEIFIF